MSLTSSVGSGVFVVQVFIKVSYITVSKQIPGKLGYKHSLEPISLRWGEKYNPCDPKAHSYSIN